MPKTKQPKPAPSELTLPEHMKLTEKETALCARLIRARRQDTYWLSYFIEHLLHMDAVSSRDVTVLQAENALKVMGTFVNWQSWFDETAKTWDALRDFPGLEWYPWGADDNVPAVAAVTERSFSKKEQLEAELKEIRASLSGRANTFDKARAHYAGQLGKALERMAEEDRKMDRNCGNGD